MRNGLTLCLLLVLAGSAQAADLGAPVPMPAKPVVCACAIGSRCVCGAVCECFAPAADKAAPVAVQPTAAFQYATVCGPNGCYQVQVGQTSAQQYFAAPQAAGSVCGPNGCGVAAPARVGLLRGRR